MPVLEEYMKTDNRVEQRAAPVVKQLSWRYYVMMSLSWIFFSLIPYSFYWYATDATKESAQAFLGAGGVFVSLILFLVFFLHAEERQKDIDYGLYIPPDRVPLPPNRHRR